VPRFGDCLLDARRPAGREVYADRRAIVAGTFRLNGVARVVDGGYRMSGRWPPASGIGHATWVLGGGIDSRADG